MFGELKKQFFGLVEIKYTDAARFQDKFELRKLPLPDHVVRFHL